MSGFATKKCANSTRVSNPVSIRVIRVGAVTNEAHAWCAKNSLIRDVIRWVTNAHPGLYYQQKHLCTAGLYAAHDPYHIRTLSLPCVKPSPTCHAALGRCGEARDEATHLAT